LVPARIIFVSTGDSTMNTSKNAETDLAALRDDLAALKNDMASLIANMTATASSSAQTAASQVDRKARDLYQGAATEMDRAARIAGQKVEEQPVTALLIAMGVGYVAGRMMSR
jgi:ElaB/YqjD/DUF883 family membrane-anchored ribosome-binding protein